VIFACDFDGYLCKSAWPNIGKPRRLHIWFVKWLKRRGHTLILWTCRIDDKLVDAVRWCKSYGLYFDAHNENLPERCAFYQNDCRKIGADFYLDDKNFTLFRFLKGLIH
jgi:hypothetical protein